MNQALGVDINASAITSTDGVTISYISGNTGTGTNAEFVSLLVAGFAYAAPPNFGQNGRIMAYGSSGGESVMSYSDDLGLNWSVVQEWDQSSTCVALAWVGDRWLAGSTSGDLAYSTTGLGNSGTDNTWTTYTPSGVALGTQNYTELLWDEARDIVLLMTANKIYRSTDKGLTWTTVFTHTGSGLEDMAYSLEQDKYIAVGSSPNYINVSTDGGLTWTQETVHEASVQITGITWSPDASKWVYVCRSGSVRTAWSTGDGVWHGVAAANAYEWEAVAAGGVDSIAPISTWDTDEQNPLTYTWKSARQVCPYLLNPGAARVEADDYPVTFRLYNDQGTLVLTKTVSDNEAFRLPGNYLTNWFEVEVESSEIVRTVHVAETMEELLPG
jgi:hypothetical protein